MIRILSSAARAARGWAFVCSAAALLALPAHAQRVEPAQAASLQALQAVPGAPAGATPAAPATILGLATDNLAERTESLVDAAMRVIGASYRWRSDEKAAGFEAGTFVRHVFKDAVGFLLPVGVENLGRMGEAVRAVDLKPGDLVFFNTMRRTFSHVGIYLGNNKFIHAPARGSEVRVDDLQSAYWDRRFEGARRITPQASH